jgi:hypothetical protein
LSSYSKKYFTCSSEHIEIFGKWLLPPGVEMEPFLSILNKPKTKSEIEKLFYVSNNYEVREKKFFKRTLGG